MDAREALAVLGLRPGVTLAEARAAYRRLVREHHPDVAGADATPRAARLTEAFAILRAAAAASGARTLDVTLDVTPPSGEAAPTGAGTAARPAPGAEQQAPRGAVDAQLASGDTIFLHAPADEAFAALFDAAGQIGHVGYVDRHLGILETIVRFEGGPTCSLLITLQGRAEGTEAFCTLESIEAAPSPPIQPVVGALVDALALPSH